MLTFLIISFLLTATKAEYNVDELEGKWLMGITYPGETKMIPNCPWYNITVEDRVDCTCGDRTNIEELLFTNLQDKDNIAIPVILINETEDALHILQTGCLCNGSDVSYGMLYVLRKIDPNNFALYVPIMTSDGQRSLAIYLFVKQLPKLSLLFKTWNNVVDLKHKRGSIFCEPNYFIPEDL